MKSSLVIIIILFITQSLIAQKDSGSIEKKGWLLYWKDVVIWVGADMHKNVDNKKFFQFGERYTDGLVVNYIPNALYYKSIAKSYRVKVISKGYEATDSIWLLPVIVRLKTGFEPEPETTIIHLRENTNEVSVEFKGSSYYDIRDLGLLRKSDKKKLKRIKNYEVFPPH